MVVVVIVGVDSPVWHQFRMRSRIFKVPVEFAATSSLCQNISIILSGHRSVQWMPARIFPQLSCLPFPSPFSIISSQQTIWFQSIYLPIYLSFHLSTIYNDSGQVFLRSFALLERPLTNAHQSAHNGARIIVFVLSMQRYAKYIHNFAQTHA